MRSARNITCTTLNTTTPHRISICSVVCNVVLAHDFPDLPPERRCDVADFVAGRLDRLSGLTRLGVLISALTVNLLITLTVPSLVARVSHLPIPILAEYFRLLRSLAYTYIWETWPNTSPSGSGAR